jgi:hypothetical protein
MGQGVSHLALRSELEIRATTTSSSSVNSAYCSVSLAVGNNEFQVCYYVRTWLINSDICPAVDLHTRPSIMRQQSSALLDDGELVVAVFGMFLSYASGIFVV